MLYARLTRDSCSKSASSAQAVQGGADFPAESLQLFYYFARFCLGNVRVHADIMYPVSATATIGPIFEWGLGTIKCDGGGC